MGSFDRIEVTCPKCGEEVIFRSRAGFGNLNIFTLEDVPEVIAADILGQKEECDCGHLVSIQGEDVSNLKAE